MGSANYSESYFGNISEKVTGSTGLKGTADEAGGTLTGDEGSGEEASEERFILKSIKALATLGQSWALMEEGIDETTRELHLPGVYMSIVVALLLIAFVVVVITWLRGR